MATKEGRRIAAKLLLAAVAVAAPCAEAQGGFTSPPSYGGGGGGGGFSVTTALLFVAVIVGFFFLGFFSFYVRRWVDRRAAARTGAVAATEAAEAGGGVGRARRRGLDPAAVETLPTMAYAAARAMMKALGAGEGEALECAVCLAEFGDEGGEGEALRLLPGCCHVFHRGCIDPWLQSHVTCPVCRADLSDPAVLAAAAAAAAAAPPPPEVDVETGNHRAPIAAPRSEHQRSRSAAEDRFTLRLPEHARREIAHRRAASLSGCGGGGARRSVGVGVGVAGGGGGGGGGFGTTLLRTLSGMRYKRESEVGAILNFIGAPTGETSGGGGGGVGETPDPGPTNSSFKRYARSITFAGFVMRGDVAAHDWRPEVFQVSSSIRSATSDPQ